uniref:Uncharacterized protein n=1 Tax=Lotus japonicus TaxID=34305 RepID=I3SAP0_LOTJA|nr:unknown [Lotus japonicus]
MLKLWRKPKVFFVIKKPSSGDHQMFLKDLTVILIHQNSSIVFFCFPNCRGGRLYVVIQILVQMTYPL